MGSGVRGSTHLLFGFDKAWKLLREAAASRRYMQPLSVSVWLQQGQLHQGGLVEHDVSLAVTVDIIVLLCVSISLPIWPLDENTLELFFPSSCKGILLPSVPSLTLGDINAHTHTQLFLLGLSYYLTEHQLIPFYLFFLLLLCQAAGGMNSWDAQFN